MTLLGHIQICTPLRQSQNLDGQLLPVPHSPNLAPLDFHLFGTLKDSQ